MNMGTGKVGHSSRDPVQGDPLNSDREMREYPPRSNINTNTNTTDDYRESYREIQSSPIVAHGGQFGPQHHNNNGDNLAPLSSPIRKSVVFLERLESSPPAKLVDSSYSQRHVRSILRSSMDNPNFSSDSFVAMDTEDTLGRDSSNDVTRRRDTVVRNLQIGKVNETNKANTGSAYQSTQTPASSVPSVSPDSIDYWVKGEIHGLTDKNNVEEFKSIIAGGLKILANSDPLYKIRWFEVYATFNNIISAATTSMNQLLQQQEQEQQKQSQSQSQKQKGNNRLRRTTREIKINNRKFNILTENMPKFMSICVPHLEHECNTLFNSSSSKRDPFSTRLLVQIIRLFESLFSNVITVRHLRRSENYLQNCKRVYQCLINSLASKNLSKSITTALILFFKNEKFAGDTLAEKGLSDMLINIVQLDCGRSKYLTLERLLVIKNILVKYPNVALEQAPVWLPTGVLPWFLMGDGILGSKMVVTSISILLDFLKRTLGVDVGYRLLFASVEEKPVTEVIPERYLSEIAAKVEVAAAGTKGDLASATMGSLLRQHIRQLALEKGEYKLSFDLWLAMVGILYNSKEGLERLIHPSSADNWIKLNVTLLKSNETTVPLLALKVWRILIYCVCRLIITNADNLKQSKEFLLLLQRPFDVAATRLDNQYVREGVIYLLHAVTFASVGVCLHDRENGAKLFPIFWNYALKTIFNTMFRMAKGQGIPVKIGVINILLRLLGSKDQLGSDVTTPQNGKHPTPRTTSLHIVRVIASSGIPLSDIQKLSEDLLKVGFPHILQLINGFIENDPTGNYTDKVLLALLDATPSELATDELLASFTNMLLKLVRKRENAGALKPAIFQLILQFTCVVFKVFYKPSNLENGILIDYLTSIEKYLSTQSEGTDFPLILQAVIQEARGTKIPEFWVMEMFLRTGNSEVKAYITNWLNTALLSPEMSQEDKFCFREVISLIPTDQVMNNFSKLLSRRPFLGTNFYDTFKLEKWDVEVLLKFIKSFTKLRGGTLDNVTVQFLHWFLSNHFEIGVINVLLPFLLTHKFGRSPGKDAVPLSSMDRSRAGSKPVDNSNITRDLPSLNIDQLIEDTRGLPIIFQMASGVYAMQHSTPDETLRYLDYILSQLENVEIGKNYRDGNGGDKDKSDNDGSHFNVCLEKFLTITFSYSLDNKWWSVLDRLTSWCLLKDKLKLIEPLLIKGDKDELVHLNPKILAALVSKIDVFDDTVKSVFSRGGTTERIELLEELIRLESAEVIFRLRKPIYEAFLNFEDGADNTSKLMMKQVVEKFNNFVVLQDENLFYGFLDTFISLLPKNFDAQYKPFIRRYIDHMESKNNDTIKTNKDTSRLLQILYGWADLEKGSSEQHEGVEVPATQESSREEEVPSPKTTHSNSEVVQTAHVEENLLSTGDKGTDTPPCDLVNEPTGGQSPLKIAYLLTESTDSAQIDNLDNDEHYSSKERNGRENGGGALTEVRSLPQRSNTPQNVTTEIVTNQHMKVEQERDNLGQDSGDRSLVLISRKSSVGIPLSLGSGDSLTQKPSSNDRKQGNDIQIDRKHGEIATDIATAASMVTPLSTVEDKVEPSRQPEVKTSTMIPEEERSIQNKAVDHNSTGQSFLGATTELRFNLGSKTVLTESSETIKIAQPSHFEGAEIDSTCGTDNKEILATEVLSTGDGNSPRNAELKRVGKVSEGDEPSPAAKRRKLKPFDEETQVVKVVEADKTSRGVSTDSHGKTSTEEENDDFIPVQATEENDAFLETLQKSISGGADNITDMSKLVSIDDEAPELKIKFPIFNSLKLLQRAKEEGMDERKSAELAATLSDNTNIETGKMENVNGQPENDLTPEEPNAQQQELEDESSGEGGSRVEAETSTSTPPSSNYFPTKKIRKLVHKLRSLSSDDLSEVGAVEKRNLRIELLDLLMRMEYYVAGDESQ